MRNQLPADTVDTLIINLTPGTLRTYAQGWHYFWTAATTLNVSSSWTLNNVVLVLRHLLDTAPFQARQGYQAVAKFPSFHKLRSSLPLQSIRGAVFRATSNPKFAGFFDISTLISTLRLSSVPSTLPLLRQRLVVILKLTWLARAIDLQRTKRQPTFYEGRMFFHMRRQVLIGRNVVHNG